MLVGFVLVVAVFSPCLRSKYKKPEAVFLLTG